MQEACFTFQLLYHKGKSPQYTFTRKLDRPKRCLPQLCCLYSHFTDLANGSYSDSQHKHTLSKLQHFNQYMQFHIKFYIVMNSDRPRKGTKNCSKGGSNLPQIQTSYLLNANLEHYHNTNPSGKKLYEHNYKCVSFIFFYIYTYTYIYIYIYIYIYRYLTVLSVSQDCMCSVQKQDN